MTKSTLLYFGLLLLLCTARTTHAATPPDEQLGPIYPPLSDWLLANSNDPNIIIEVDNILEQFQRPDSPAPQTVTGKYWQRRYHRQIDEQVFNVLRYPFYESGQPYPQQSALSTAIQPTTDPNTAIDPTASYYLELICDMIHHWRNINESEASTLEIRHAIELTKTDTHIYQIAPDLAVQTKRTLGQIGRTNENFDRLSRLAMQQTLQGHVNLMLTSRLEKQMADLHGLLDRLAIQNDAIGQTLGIGKINRTPAIPDYLDQIDYSAARLPVTSH